MSDPRLRGLAVGAFAAAAGYPPLARAGSTGWQRHNFRERDVSLAAGPALAVGVLAGTLAGAGRDRRLPAAMGLAVIPAALAGGYDDLAGSAAARGLRGHLGALRAGELTTGAVKVAAIGTGALLAGAVLERRPFEALAAGALIAATADVVNLLDLRPGRAAKVSLLAAGALLARTDGWPVAGAAGAVAALLPGELAERAMLGDAGANALGAALGVSLAAASGVRLRRGLLATVTALILLSERVSFSAVIEATPALRWFDRLGRLP